MKIRSRWLGMAVCIAALPLSAVGQAPRVAPGQNAALRDVHILHVDRNVLGEDVVHYRFEVTVGPGEFDRIRLHRIVRERHPHQPIRTFNGVLLLAGSPNYFEAMFLPASISQAVAWNHSIAVFLAKNGVDVWGMDYGWALVPAETTDFTFMKNWGIEKDSQHAQIALSLARLLRVASGQGPGPLHMLGFSYGGIIAYSVAASETQQRRFLRNVRGLIPFDVGIKIKEDEYRQVYCNSLTIDQGNLDAGIYTDDTGLFLKGLSDLSISAPTDQSDIIPGLTNYQAALFFGTSTELLTGQFWHFVAGAMDENGIPYDLRNTEARLWQDVLGNIPPHLPVKTNFDTDAAFCGAPPVKFDDHLGQITVPILYVGAAGGFGAVGEYTTSLTASRDITKMIVRLMPDDQRAVDFGHAETVLARDAETLIWRPVLDWLVAHR